MAWNRFPTIRSFGFESGYLEGRSRFWQWLEHRSTEARLALTLDSARREEKKIIMTFGPDKYDDNNFLNMDALDACNLRNLEIDALSRL